MWFSVCSTDKKLLRGVEELSSFCGFRLGDEGRRITAIEGKGGLVIEAKGKDVSISYSKRAEFYLGLSFCIQHYAEEEFSLRRSCCVEELGFFRDCAKNATLHRKGFQDLVKTLALLGFDRLELYVEDLLEIRELPYLGHARARYTQEDLRAFFEYAEIFGITLIPCIQALSPVSAIGRHDVFAEILDSRHSLLVGEEKTYAFLEKIIAFCALLPVKSIHLGMRDTTEFVLGRYCDKFGYPHDKIAVLVSHISRVAQICKRYDLSPVVFWDGLEGLLAETGENAKEIEEKLLKIKEKLSEDVTFVFSGQEEKEERFAQISCVSDKIVFSSDVYAGFGFAPCNTLAEKDCLKSLAWCQRKGVRVFTLHSWASLGGEGSVFASLSVWLAVSEKAYGGDVATAALNARSLALFGNTYEEFRGLENLNYPRKQERKILQNPCTYLFYNDPLNGAFDAHAYAEMADFYRDCAREQEKARGRGGRFGYLFHMLSRLSESLCEKATYGIELIDAYKKEDNETLRMLGSERIEEILQGLQEVYDCFKEQWEEENRDWGFEWIDLRFGGLEERFRYAQKRINAYLSGALQRIEELEQPRLPYGSKDEKGDDVLFADYKYIATGSIL